MTKAGSAQAGLWEKHSFGGQMSQDIYEPVYSQYEYLAGRNTAVNKAERRLVVKDTS